MVVFPESFADGRAFERHSLERHSRPHPQGPGPCAFRTVMMNVPFASFTALFDIRRRIFPWTIGGVVSGLCLKAVETRSRPSPAAVTTAPAMARASSSKPANAQLGVR